MGRVSDWNHSPRLRVIGGLIGAAAGLVGVRLIGVWSLVIFGAACVVAGLAYNSIRLRRDTRASKPN